MFEEPCRMAIVVDRNFGKRLDELAARMPVWIVDSPANRPWVDGYWALAEGDVTRFTARDEDGPEAMALGQLASVDLHYGEYSADPPWSEMEFFGVSPTDTLRAELAGYGVERIEPTGDGFIASRMA